MLKAQIEAVEALAPGADHVTAERAAKMIAALAKTAETLGDLKVQEDRVQNDNEPGRLPDDDDAIERLRADLERRLARLSASFEQKRDVGQAEPERPATNGSSLGLLGPS
jgi:hypothetical protein